MRTTYTENELPELLGLSGSRIITLVGAGGKTSLMNQLAAAFSELGYKTLLTTSLLAVEEEDLGAVREAFRKTNLVGLGIPCASLAGNRTKWSSPSLEFLEEISDFADIILCEGDGSKRLPVKLPRDNEPVFCPGTDTVIGLVGLSCLGRKKEDILFGLAESSHPDVSVIPDPIDIPFLLDLVQAPWGLKKGIRGEKFLAVFNQADLLNSAQSGCLSEGAQKIRDNGGLCRIVSLKNHMIIE